MGKEIGLDEESIKNALENKKYAEMIYKDIDEVQTL